MSDNSRTLFHAGDQVDGRYEIVSKLGSGGFGTVYKAIQLSTRQEVAIKVLHASPNPGDSELGIARFDREMKLIAQLKHPHIVRLIDTGKTTAGAVYNVLELIDGQPLDVYIKEKGPLDVRTSQHLMFQVLDALSCAHQNGVVHRDLKPSNIMVTASGYRPNATVLDFGISTIVEAARPEDYVDLTAELGAGGYTKGTPAYLAPEVVRQGISSQQCDVYAWGLVFLECMTGAPVVDGPTDIVVLLEQGSDDPVLIPEGLELPPVLHTLITRAIAKPLDVRFESATETIQAYELLLTEGPDALDAPKPIHAPAGLKDDAVSFEADPTELMAFSPEEMARVKAEAEAIRARGLANAIHARALSSADQPDAPLAAEPNAAPLAAEPNPAQKPDLDQDIATQRELNRHDITLDLPKEEPQETVPFATLPKQLEEPQETVPFAALPKQLEEPQETVPFATLPKELKEPQETAPDATLDLPPLDLALTETLPMSSLSDAEIDIHKEKTQALPKLPDLNQSTPRPASGSRPRSTPQPTPTADEEIPRTRAPMLAAIFVALVIGLAVWGFLNSLKTTEQRSPDSNHRG